MKLILKNANAFVDGVIKKTDILVCDGHIADMALSSFPSDAEVIDLNNMFLFPGFIDVHVHLREPGFSYKETILSGTQAAKCGGYTSVCAMPNVKPVPDSAQHLSEMLELIKAQAVVRVYPYGAITAGEKGEVLSDMADMAQSVIAFSDDGVGVADRQIMKAAMLTAKKYGKIIAAHCEDMELRRGGYIHMGKYAKLHGHAGICSESEYKPIERDLELAYETGAAYHVCHVSAKESVQMIREAKKKGVNVTCETAPHYLVLDDSDLKEEGRFKMNPPLRSREDREALLEGIADGTIDMIATDHAPHSAQEKSGGLKDSLMGVVGLENAFPVLYTELVLKKKLTLERLVELMSVKPAQRFGLKSGFAVGDVADLTVFDLNEKYVIDPDKFATMGRSTPFEGREVYGKCIMTLVGGVRV